MEKKPNERDKTKVFGELVVCALKCVSFFWLKYLAHPETNSSPLKMDGDSYWKPPFLGAMLVSGSVDVTLGFANSDGFFVTLN